MTIQQLGETLMQRAGVQAAERQRLEQKQAVLEEERECVARLVQVVDVLQAVQETWRERFQGPVSKIVSDGLTRVFGKPLKFELELGVSGDLPVAEFYCTANEGVRTKLLGSRSGGYINIIAFLLRDITILAVPSMRRLLLLDESFNNIHVDCFPNVVSLMRHIWSEGGFQQILVTQIDDLVEAGDVRYRFSNIADGPGVIDTTAVERIELLAAGT